MPKQFLEAGKIVGTHGVRGDLRVQSWCDSPEVLCDFDLLYLDENTPVTVEKAQVHKNVVLMHLKGVDTVEAAKRCAGACCTWTGTTWNCRMTWCSSRIFWAFASMTCGPTVRSVVSAMC